MTQKLQKSLERILVENDIEKPEDFDFKTMLDLLESGVFVIPDDKKIERFKYSEDVAKKTVEKIMDVFCVGSLEDMHCIMATNLVRSGLLTCTSDGEVRYRLSRKVEVHGQKQQQEFVLKEPTLSQIESAGIDMDSMVMDTLGGFAPQESKGKFERAKVLARLCINLEEDFADKMVMSDVVNLNGLFKIFFLS